MRSTGPTTRRASLTSPTFLGLLASLLATACEPPKDDDNPPPFPKSSADVVVILLDRSRSALKKHRCPEIRETIRSTSSDAQTSWILVLGTGSSKKAPPIVLADWTELKTPLPPSPWEEKPDVETKNREEQVDEIVDLCKSKWGKPAHHSPLRVAAEAAVENALAQCKDVDAAGVDCRRPVIAMHTDLHDFHGVLTRKVVRAWKRSKTITVRPIPNAEEVRWRVCGVDQSDPKHHGRHYPKLAREAWRMMIGRSFPEHPHGTCTRTTKT